MAFVPAVAPGIRSLRAPLRCSSRAVTVSAFRGARVAAPVAPARAPVRMEFEISECVEYELNIVVLVIALFGWIVPSSIPAPIALTNGAGLSPAFFASVSANLANWPAGPSAADPFWTLCFMWHIGMFATMFFGTIGYNLNKNY
jgi:photosystem I protein PsaO